MKTHDLTNSHHLCENQLSESLSWSRLRSALGRFMRVRMNLSYSPIHRAAAELLAALVAPGLTAGLRALVASIGANNRIYWGLVLMGVVSPLSACVYMLFSRTEVIDGWYYVNYFHLFLTIGPSLFVFFLLTGAFLLFPDGCKRAYALVVPTGYTISKILWLLTVTSNEQFWQMPTGSFLFAGVLISFTLFIMLDWLAHNKFHGLYNIADAVDDTKFKSMFVQTMRAKKEFRKKF
jgi:hypothetical protein